MNKYLQVFYFSLCFQLLPVNRYWLGDGVNTHYFWILALAKVFMCHTFEHPPLFRRWYGSQGPFFWWHYWLIVLLCNLNSIACLQMGLCVCTISHSASQENPPSLLMFCLFLFVAFWMPAEKNWHCRFGGWRHNDRTVIDCRCIKKEYFSCPSQSEKLFVLFAGPKGQWVVWEDDWGKILKLLLIVINSNYTV